MTITVQSTRNEYTATAGQDVFTYTFKIFTATDLNVYVTPAGQECDDTTDITTAYTVAGVGVAAGGSITLNTPASVGDLVSIVSNIPASRTTDYQTNGDFRPDTVNDDFDRVVSLVKQSEEVANRSLVSSECLQGSKPLTLPEPSAGLFLKWKSDLSGVENSGAPSVAVNTVEFSVVSDMIASTTLNIGDLVQTAGYTAKGDGGDNLYEIVAAATGTDDGGSFLDLDTHQAKGLFPGGVVSVKQFGAVGDDVADDTTAVMNAVAAMTNNSALYVPSGIYLVDDTIDLTDKQDIGIHGDGWGASIIKRTNGTFGDTLLFARTDPTTNQIRGLTLKDIQFYAAVDVTTGAVLHIKNAIRIDTNGVFIRNCHRGIHLEGIRDSRFDNLEIISNEFHTTTRTTSCHLLIDAPADATKRSTETFFSNFNFTTASGKVDLERSIQIKGELDGLFFNDGHVFGGNSEGMLIDGNTQAQLQGLTFSNVWFDQFTDNNLSIQGTTTSKFRYITFNNCRLWGGGVNIVSIDSASSIEDVTFVGCELGVTQGMGVQIGAGVVSFKACTFKAINQAVAGNGYAIQTVAGADAGTIVSATGCEFELSNLTFGIQCVKTTTEYHFHDNVFRNDGGSISAEILFNANDFIGTCSGNKTDRTAAGDITAGATTTMSNIATDSINLTGATVSLANLFPRWHGRRVTLKADANTQNIVSGGNMRNKANASPVAILAADMGHYEYSEDSARWHEL